MGISSLALWIVLHALFVTAQGASDSPFVLGLCAAEGDEAHESALGFVRGARLAAEIRNRRGGSSGTPWS